MAGISFSGLASGLDTEAIINALVGVQRIPITRLEQENSYNQSKIGIIDRLSSAMSSLRTAAQNLDTRSEFLSYKGSIGDEKVASVTSGGSAVPGTYRLEVEHLAQAQRTYSNPLASRTTALSDSDQTLTLTIAGKETEIALAAGGTLEDLATAINGSGADVMAGIMFDGSNYRLQVVGKSTGTTNAITFSDSGLGLGLSEASNTVQAARDAAFSLDGIPITSPDNLVDEVIPGTTIELRSETKTGEFTTITVKEDASAVRSKLDAFISAYNSVFTIINDQVGQGKGRNTLNGDATLRGLEQSLSRLVSSPIGNLTTAGGDTLQLADLGIKTQNDGKLTLDATRFDETLAKGFENAARYFAGDASAPEGKGFSALLDELVEGYTSTTNGLLKARKDGLNLEVKNNTTRMEGLELLLEQYEASLRNQYTALESAMSTLRSQQSYLASFLQR